MAENILLIDPTFLQTLLALHPELRHEQRHESSTRNLPYSLSAALDVTTRWDWLAVYTARALHWDLTGKRTSKNDACEELEPLHPEVFDSLARTLAFGRAKHGAESWKDLTKLGSLEDVRGKLIRHLIARACGHKVNSATGLYHASQALAKTMFLWWHSAERLAATSQPEV